MYTDPAGRGIVRMQKRKGVNPWRDVLVREELPRARAQSGQPQTGALTVHGQEGKAVKQTQQDCCGLNCAPHLNSQVEVLTLGSGILHFIALHFIGLCVLFFFFLTNRRLVATLHQASLLAPFFQRHLTTLCLRVTFSQFLQYFKLFNYYYICYSDV